MRIMRIIGAFVAVSVICLAVGVYFNPDLLTPHQAENELVQTAKGVTDGLEDAAAVMNGTPAEVVELERENPQVQQANANLLVLAGQSIGRLEAEAETTTDPARAAELRARIKAAKDGLAATIASQVSAPEPTNRPLTDAEWNRTKERLNRVLSPDYKPDGGQPENPFEENLKRGLPDD